MKDQAPPKQRTIATQGKTVKWGGRRGTTKNLPIMSPAIASLGLGEVKGYTGIPLKQKKQ